MFPEGVASTSREPEQGRRCTPLCQRLSSPLRGQRICHSMVCVPSFTASAVPRQKVCVQPRGEKVCVIQLDSPSYNFSCHSLGSCACLSLGAVVMPRAMMWRSAVVWNRVTPFSTLGAIVSISPTDPGSPALSLLSIHGPKRRWRDAAEAIVMACCGYWNTPAYRIRCTPSVAPWHPCD